jgi:hypothetical protein
MAGGVTKNRISAKRSQLFEARVLFDLICRQQVGRRTASIWHLASFVRIGFVLGYPTANLSIRLRGTSVGWLERRS